MKTDNIPRLPRTLTVRHRAVTTELLTLLPVLPFPPSMVSADVTHAESELADSSRHAGLLYARSMSRTGTILRLAGYRYSTEGFNTLEEMALKSMRGRLYDEDTTDADGRPLPSAYSSQYNLYNARDGTQADDTGWFMSPHKSRSPHVHQQRPCRACTEELIQIDGCEHRWFEDRGPARYVYDATSWLMQLFGVNFHLF